MLATTPAGVLRHWRAGALALATGAVVGGLAIASPATAATQTTGAVKNASVRLTTPQTSSALRSTKFAPARTTHAALSASTASVRRGSAATLTASVTYGSTLTRVQSQVVRLQVRSGNTWRDLATTTLSGNGYATFSVRPTGTTTYRLAYTGGGTLGPSWSGTVTVKVASTPSSSGTSSSSGSFTNLPAGSGRAAAVLAAARAQSGKPYAWGAAGPRAYDCSGLTMYAFRSVGVSLPHQANAQKGYGVAVSRAQARPGDLVIFVSGSYGYHAGIYAGNGYMVDAPTYGQTVGLHKIWGSNVIFRRIV